MMSHLQESVSFSQPFLCVVLMKNQRMEVAAQVKTMIQGAKRKKISLRSKIQQALNFSKRWNKERIKRRVEEIISQNPMKAGQNHAHLHHQVMESRKNLIDKVQDERNKGNNRAHPLPQAIIKHRRARVKRLYLRLARNKRSKSAHPVKVTPIPN